MSAPALELLRSAVHPAITAAAAQPIKQSSMPAEVYRLRLAPAGGSVPATLIAKRIRPDWPDDPHGAQREARFYACLLPQLAQQPAPLPHAPVYYAGPEPGTPNQIVLMADLAPSHRFVTPLHLWSPAEIAMIVRTYARLHVAGQAALATIGDRAWLFARHEARLAATGDRLPSMVDAIVDAGYWPGALRSSGRRAPVAALRERVRAAMARLAAAPVTILHNDVYPPNAALPYAPDGDVILVDWEMAGQGLAELDLGFMFLQPFGSDRQLDRAAVLAAYWAERERLETAVLGQPSVPPAERPFRQWYADALWALWLIPVAYRMATAPHPPGTAVRRYWEAMFPVLGRRLQGLVDG